MSALEFIRKTEWAFDGDVFYGRPTAYCSVCRRRDPKGHAAGHMKRFDGTRDAFGHSPDCQIPALLAEGDEQKALSFLRTIEWADVEYRSSHTLETQHQYKGCFYCDGLSEEGATQAAIEHWQRVGFGHAEDCELAATLKDMSTK